MSKKERKSKDKRYYEKTKSIKSKNWWFVFYPDDLPDDWKQRLINLNMRIFISPLHEHDQNADGQPKKPHHHVIFMFDSIKSLSQLWDMLHELFPVCSGSELCGIGHFCKSRSEPDGSTSQVIVHSIVQATRYLAHLDNPEKYQYNPEQIEALGGADVLQYLKKTTREIIDTYIDIQNIIQENELKEYFDLCNYLASNGEYDMFELVARHATVHFKAYIESYRHKEKNLEVARLNKVIVEQLQEAERLKKEIEKYKNSLEL